jgi:hypothetical protein
MKRGLALDRSLTSCIMATLWDRFSGQKSNPAWLEGYPAGDPAGA